MKSFVFLSLFFFFTYWAVTDFAVEWIAILNEGAKYCHDLLSGIVMKVDDNCFLKKLIRDIYVMLKDIKEVIKSGQIWLER